MRASLRDYPRKCPTGGRGRWVMTLGSLSGKIPQYVQHELEPPVSEDDRVVGIKVRLQSLLDL